MTYVGNGASLHLKDAKSTVPSEHATSAGVRQWLLRLLENRNVELPNGPVGFVCHWNGVELHSLHPNHLFGSFISQGVAPQTAHHVVGDVMECLEVMHYSARPKGTSRASDIPINNTEQEYRARRSFSLAAGQTWSHDAESGPRPRMGDEEEQDERHLLLGDEGDREASSKGSESPKSWYSSLVGSPCWLAAAGVSILTGIGVVAWLVAGPPTPERETERQEFLVGDFALNGLCLRTLAATHFEVAPLSGKVMPVPTEQPKSGLQQGEIEEL
ncbi:hypothetical protein CSUB01_08413 [Colletotrichum sublineola]|uniref:Uncharacterized protein n=1 Tax=Colletotrichum sublineola TaxID=1173701 RepID=A0A066XRM9_COLSU|nr:hypothetical protein CSUB01_08413 [Colletotrichum sublineola]